MRRNTHLAMAATSNGGRFEVAPSAAAVAGSSDAFSRRLPPLTAAVWGQATVAARALVEEGGAMFLKTYCLPAAVVAAAAAGLRRRVATGEKENAVALPRNASITAPPDVLIL